jgi:UDP-N-acetylmuramyl pentapeptide phosphotransferase/UDP-N-acetylglucosamine-1-phosphate transferase
MSNSMTTMWTVVGAGTTVFSAIACVILIVILRPVLRRHALAEPNVRSSHREPTPQGGGIAVVVATLAAACLGMFSLGIAIAGPFATVLAATVLMAAVGAADDIRPLAVTPRLVLQALAIAAAIYALPDQLRVVPVLPWWIERVLLFAGGLWFVNLVNFMDGIDWMTVAEVIPITVALAAIGWLGKLALDAVIVAVALGGAMLGFAYFNRPEAKLFLGDVGSLPIGLLLGWLLVLLAGQGALAAAILLPLYYLADATLTLLRRLLAGQRVWQAHRMHFYQRATERGFSVTEVIGRVFAVNLSLGALALATVAAGSHIVNIAALVCGAAMVGWLLWEFARGRK